MEECYNDNRVKIPALFYADDGPLLTHTQAGTQQILTHVTNIAMPCGLEINKTKSNILAFSVKNPPSEIADIKLVESIKYPGVTITNAKKF